MNCTKHDGFPISGKDLENLVPSSMIKLQLDWIEGKQKFTINISDIVFDLLSVSLEIGPVLFCSS
jgi:hypothetical protein